DLRRVVLDLHYFSMARAPGADLSVGRVLRPSACVADGGGDNALHLPERRLHAPETTCAKHSFLCHGNTFLKLELSHYTTRPAYFAAPPSPFMLKLMRRRSGSTPRTRTWTVWPMAHTSPGWRMRRSAIWETWTRPSWWTPISTKAPKSVTLV